jgi:micrococcal nuclease
MFLAVTIALAAMAVWPAFSEDLPERGTVKAVFDGDSVLLSSGHEVRYLGINAPEVSHEDEPGECYGREARSANRRLVLGETVSLKYDREKKDRYGRLLAYVYTLDGQCVNEAMIRMGCAYVYKVTRDFTRFARFLALQRETLRHRRGRWGECTVEEEDFYRGNRNSTVFHRPDCPFGKKIGRGNRIRFDSRRSAFEKGYRPCRRCRP